MSEQDGHLLLGSVEADEEVDQVKAGELDAFEAVEASEEKEFLFTVFTIFLLFLAEEFETVNFWTTSRY